MGRVSAHFPSYRDSFWWTHSSGTRVLKRASERHGCVFLPAAEGALMLLRDLQNASGPAYLDTLVLEFNNPLPPRDVSSTEKVNELLLFNPPIRNVTYTG